MQNRHVFRRMSQFPKTPKSFVIFVTLVIFVVSRRP